MLLKNNIFNIAGVNHLTANCKNMKLTTLQISMHDYML